MNKVYKRILNLVVMTVMVFAMSMVAFAQGTTMIAVSKESPSVGDKVTVSITASESGTVTVKYTSSMLTFSSCNVSGYSASGNTVSFSGKSGNIVFSAATAGNASIIVSSSSCSGSSTTLAIGGGSSAASTETTVEEKPAEETTVVEEEPAETEESTETEEPATETEASAATVTGDAVGSLNSQGGFDINGVSYVVSERFADSDMPSGFSKKTVKIGSSTYSEPTNGSITLLYLKQADNIGGSGTFYMYNAEAGTVSEFLMINTSSDSVILSNADSAPSTAFQATTLEVTGGTATAYTISGSEFYYVYGTNKAGNTGWFIYDSANETISRLDESLLSATSASTSVDDSTDVGSDNDKLDSYVKKLDTYRKVIMVLIVLCVILVFVIINSMVKSKGKDDDDFDGDVFANTPEKPKKKLPRSIVFGSKRNEVEEDEYDDEEEEEYYEDDYEEEEETTRSSNVIESASDYDLRRSSSLNMMDLNDL